MVFSDAEMQRFTQEAMTEALERIGKLQAENARLRKQADAGRYLARHGGHSYYCQRGGGDGGCADDCAAARRILLAE